MYYCTLGKKVSVENLGIFYLGNQKEFAGQIF